MEQSLGRPERRRCKIASWWRSAMTSNSNSARLRNRQASQEKTAEMNASMPRHYSRTRNIARLFDAFGAFGRDNHCDRYGKRVR
jgi:hypothetical protein